MSAAPRFTVCICSTDDRVNLCCTGEIDLANVDLLRKPLDQQLADSNRELTVDLRAVSYLDSAAIKELLRGAIFLFHRGQRLRVRVTAHQQRLFVLFRCDRLLAIEVV
jgi:anti-anti-sigma factor